MRALGALAFVTTVGVTLANAQATTPGQIVQPQQGQPSTTAPQRMPARPLRPGEAPPKGSAVIKGTVVAADTGSPIRRAQVTARSMEGRGGGVTSTDGQGRYEIRDLPAGRFTIMAAKGGFVQSSFGQRRATDPGTPIDLADGQTAEKVNFILSRGSVITGRIVDDGGEPVSGAQVSAMRYAYVSGTRRLVPAGAEGSSRSTDDQGHYRLYGLPPGEYYVSANLRSGMVMMPGMNNTESESYAPTYFPGTPNVSEAARVVARVGQEAGASFAMVVARMARVSGRALNSSGQPVSNAMLMMTPADPGGMVMMMGMNNAMIGADGTFQFSNIAPGRYNLQLRPNGMATASTEVAMMPVTVGNEDIENLIVVSAPTATARGVVLTDDGTPPTFRADQVSVFAGPAEPTTMFMSPGQNRMNDDYTFEITGLFDRRLFRGSAGPPAASGWYLKSVLYEGTDITDTGMEFTPGRTYEGLQVIFTRKTTDLSGTLTDDRGNAVVDATVIMFPADQQKWTYSSRYVRTARPDTNGKYNIKSMPPLDDYLIIAVQNLESGQGSDPEFLSRAREEAKSFSLAEGETKNVDVKLSKLVP
jgi:protocatechuate 3,4-dioxygenase beta subunit